MNNPIPHTHHVSEIIGLSQPKRLKLTEKLLIIIGYITIFILSCCGIVKILNILGVQEL